MLLSTIRVVVAAIVVLLTTIALTGPVAKEARELRRGRSHLEQRYQTMPDPLCTLHLFWLLFSSLPPFPRSTLSIIPSFVRSRSLVLGLVLVLVLLLAHSHSLVLRISILSLPQPSSASSHPPPRIMVTTLSHSLHHPCCITLSCCHALAASPSLRHPRCPTLAALPSLHRLAPTSHLCTHHTVGSDQPPLQVLLCVDERTCCIEKPPWRLPHS